MELDWLPPASIPDDSTTEFSVKFCENNRKILILFSTSCGFHNRIYENRTNLRFCMETSREDDLKGVRLLHPYTSPSEASASSKLCTTPASGDIEGCRRVPPP